MGTPRLRDSDPPRFRSGGVRAGRVRRARRARSGGDRCVRCAEEVAPGGFARPDYLETGAFAAPQEGELGASGGFGASGEIAAPEEITAPNGVVTMSQMATFDDMMASRPAPAPERTAPPRSHPAGRTAPRRPGGPDRIVVAAVALALAIFGRLAYLLVVGTGSTPIASAAAATGLAAQRQAASGRRHRERRIRLPRPPELFARRDPSQRPACYAHPGPCGGLRPPGSAARRQPAECRAGDRSQSPDGLANRLAHRQPFRQPEGGHRPAAGHGTSRDDHQRPDNTRRYGWRRSPASGRRTGHAGRPAASSERGQRPRHDTAASGQADPCSLCAHLVHPAAAGCQAPTR